MKQMPRALRRRLEKGAVSENLQRELINFGSELVIDTYGIAVAKTALDKTSLTKDEIKTMMAEISELFAAILSDHVSVNDCRDVVMEELDIMFDIDRK
jgi:hypothetical protein